MFFFLSEYSSIVLFSSLILVLFLGVYNLPSLNLTNLNLLLSETGNIITQIVEFSRSALEILPGFENIIIYFNKYDIQSTYSIIQESITSPFSLIFLINGSIILGLKTCFIASLFVGARALLARYKYSDLINLCWLGLLPLVIALTLFYPAILIQDFLIYKLLI